MKLACRDRVLALDRPAIMGVLNVTPDSFSDGGLWLEQQAAVSHALAMVEQGAAIIDVGGESTRPGAQPVPEDVELGRVIPVIDALAAATTALISIDTRKPRVAQAALEAGAHILNDTAGEASDRAMDMVAADAGAAIVVMHSRGTPATMRDLTTYTNVVGEVTRFLGGRAEELRLAGVEATAIALDPGIGFAKTPEQSLALLNRLESLVELGYPVLVGTSRKSFIGHVLDLAVEDRIEGTIASVVWALAKGAAIVRVHDLEPVARAVMLASAIASEGETG